MDKKYRLNGLPRVIFPTNIVTSEIREIYKDTLEMGIGQDQTQQRQKQREQHRQQQRQLESTTETGSVRQKICEHSAEGAVAMDTDTDSSKRNRESWSPDIHTLSQEQKKKREEEYQRTRELEQLIEEKRQIPQIRPPQAPPKQARSECMIGTEKVSGEEVGERRRQTERICDEKKERSQSRQKEVGITVYFKQSSKYNLQNRDVERLWKAIINGETKIHW